MPEIWPLSLVAPNYCRDALMVGDWGEAPSLAADFSRTCGSGSASELPGPAFNARASFRFSVTCGRWVPVPRAVFKSVSA